MEFDNEADMATPNLLHILGVPDVVPGKRLSPLHPEHVAQPAIRDNVGARELLVHLRTLDPSYKPPQEKKLGFLPGKKRKEALDDPSSGPFSNPEIARAVTFAISKNVPGAVTIVAALFAMGADQGATAEKLWSCGQDNGQRIGPSFLKFIRPERTASTSQPPCPWLQIAARMGSLPLVHLLFSAGLSQKTLDYALEATIQAGTDHCVEKELVALGADFPVDPDFLVTVMSSASSHRVLQLTELLLSTHHPPRHLVAIAAMKRTVKILPTDRNLQEALSTFLANLTLAPLEAYEMVLAAIEGRNLSALAAMSLADGDAWKHIRDTGGAQATTLAAHVDDDEIRFRLLNFLQLVGATLDTSALRDRLLHDAKSGNLKGVNQLLLFGVTPGWPTAHSDTGTLGWAAQSLDLPLFDLILATAKVTPQAASGALRHLPERAPDTAKIKIIRSLAERGASCEELSRQLFFSVRNSEDHVVEMLLQLGATATYRDRDGGSALSTAVRLGNALLIINLLPGAPADIVSEAIPYALAGFHDQEQTFVSVLKAMVSRGAHGPPVDDTVLKTLDHPGPATEQILMVLLPVGLGSVASGKAVLALARQAATVRSLELLCETSAIPETALGSALKIVLSHETFNMEKARVLAETVRRTGRGHILDHVLVHFHRGAYGNGYQIVDFLLASGASIDAGDGCVVAAEASRGNLARLGEMMRRIPSTATLENALKTALSSMPPGPVQRDILRLILDTAATDIGHGDVVLRAVQDDDMDLLTMVIIPPRRRVRFSVQEALWYAVDHVRDRAVSVFVQTGGIPTEIAASALDRLMGGRCLENTKAVNIAGSLLRVGVNSGAKDAALWKAFSAVTTSGALPVHLIHLLVSKGANAYQQDGLLFRTASQKRETAVLWALTTAPFPLDQVAHIVMESSDEGSASYVAEALGICVAQSTNKFKDNALLKVALSRYPTSDAIITLLLGNGCTASFQLLEDVTGGVQDMLLFPWAADPERRVSDKVLLKILSATSQSDLMAIPPSSIWPYVVEEAASREDPAILKQLKSRGHPIDLETPYGPTALALATSRGNLRAIKALISAGSRPNDGSLNEAAHLLDVPAIKLLRASGHDVNWPCSYYDGDIPVLTLISAPRERQPTQREFEDALESLTPFPEAKCQEGERSLLHYILDLVPCPVPMLQAYARVARLHEHPFKDDYYLFKEPGSNICYSPTMYVWFYRPYRRRKQERKKLYGIVRRLSFQDRYYAESGPQPDCYTEEALPPSVRYAMERERDAEEERRRLDEEERRRLDEEDRRCLDEYVQRRYVQRRMRGSAARRGYRDPHLNRY